MAQVGDPATAAGGEEGGRCLAATPLFVHIEARALKISTRLCFHVGPEHHLDVLNGVDTLVNGIMGNLGDSLFKLEKEGTARELQILRQHVVGSFEEWQALVDDWKSSAVRRIAVLNEQLMEAKDAQRRLQRQVDDVIREHRQKVEAQPVALALPQLRHSGTLQHFGDAKQHLGRRSTLPSQMLFASKNSAAAPLTAFSDACTRRKSEPTADHESILRKLQPVDESGNPSCSDATPGSKGRKSGTLELLVARVRRSVRGMSRSSSVASPPLEVPPAQERPVERPDSPEAHEARSSGQKRSFMKMEASSDDCSSECPSSAASFPESVLAALQMAVQPSSLGVDALPTTIAARPTSHQGRQCTTADAEVQATPAVEHSGCQAQPRLAHATVQCREATQATTAAARGVECALGRVVAIGEEHAAAQLLLECGTSPEGAPHSQEPAASLDEGAASLGVSSFVAAAQLLRRALHDGTGEMHDFDEKGSPRGGADVLDEMKGAVDVIDVTLQAMRSWLQRSVTSPTAVPPGWVQGGFSDEAFAMAQQLSRRIADMIGGPNGSRPELMAMHGHGFAARSEDSLPPLSPRRGLRRASSGASTARFLPTGSLRDAVRRSLGAGSSFEVVLAATPETLPMPSPKEGVPQGVLPAIQHGTFAGGGRLPLMPPSSVEAEELGEAIAAAMSSVGTTDNKVTKRQSRRSILAS